MALAAIFYAALPDFNFPEPPPGAKQSHEAADSETPLRRAYFTDLSREEVMAHYKQELQKSSYLGISLPTYRLNYPPEEAQTIIRDQVKSTFLEEIVHPLRESLFVNGFEPKDSKYAINIEGVHYRQKITVRFVPSNIPARVVITILGLSSLFYVSKNLITNVGEFLKS